MHPNSAYIGADPSCHCRLPPYEAAAEVGLNLTPNLLIKGLLFVPLVQNSTVMRVSHSLPFALLAAIPATFSQVAPNATFLQGLANALNASGLTQLATAAASINGTVIGQELLADLSIGNLTIFAPNNQAFSNISSNISSNATLFSEYLSYHVVRGNFTNLTATFPNVTIGRTFLNASDLVELEGNKSQVLAFTNVNGTVRVLNQPTNVTVLNSTTYANLNVFVIDAVLRPPGNLSTVLTFNNLTALQTLLGQVTVPDPANGTNTTLSAVLNSDEIHGYTLFVPNNAAVQAANSTLAGLTPINSQLQVLLGNHIINATTAYSTLLFSNITNYTSAAGEPFTFTRNSSGSFVTSGNSTARIVQSDVLVKNGVVHVIDQVLVDLQSNASAASSAYACATSAAAKTVTETGPVTGISFSSWSSSGPWKSAPCTSTSVSASTTSASSSTSTTSTSTTSTSTSSSSSVTTSGSTSTTSTSASGSVTTGSASASA